MTYLDWQASSGGEYRGGIVGGGELSCIAPEQRGEKWDKWHRLLIFLKRPQQAIIEMVVTIQRIPVESHKAIYEERFSFVNTLNRLGHLITEINDFYACADAQTGVISESANATTTPKFPPPIQ